MRILFFPICLTKLCTVAVFYFFLSQKTPKNCNEEKTWLCPKTGPLTCSKYLLGSVLRFPQSHRTSAFPSRLKAKLLFLTTRCLAIPIDSQSDQSACCGRSRGSPSGLKRTVFAPQMGGCRVLGQAWGGWRRGLGIRATPTAAGFGTKAR